MRSWIFALLVALLFGSVASAKGPKPVIHEPIVVYDRTMHGYTFYRWGTSLGGRGYTSCIVDLYFLDKSNREVAKDTVVVRIRPSGDGVESILEVLAVPMHEAVRITGYDITMTCY